jgi:hypothetical protein
LSGGRWLRWLGSRRRPRVWSTDDRLLDLLAVPFVDVVVTIVIVSTFPTEI